MAGVSLPLRGETSGWVSGPEPSFPPVPGPWFPPHTLRAVCQTGGSQQLLSRASS